MNDETVKSILFAFICIGAVFANSCKYVDSQIMPKWFIMFAGIILLVTYSIVRLFLCFDKKYVDKKGIGIYAIGIIIIIVTFWQAFYGISQFFNILSPTTDFQVTGSFDNPAGFASSLCVAFPLYICAFLQSKKICRWIISSMIVVVAMAVVLSASRAGILSLVMILLFFSMKNFKQYKRTKWILLPLFLSVTLTGLYVLKKDSADGRLLIWKCSLAMVKDNLLVGHGTGGFQAHYMDYQADYFRNNPDSLYTQLAGDVQRPFNEYIHIMVDYGVVGLLILFTCVAYLMRCYFKYPTLENKVAISCWLSVGVFAFFSYPLLYPFVWLVLVFSAYLLIRKDMAKLLKHVSYKIQCILALPVLCLLVYSGIQFCHRLQSEWEWKKAAFGESEATIGHYPQLAEAFKNNRYFLYNYSVVLFENHRLRESFIIARQCRKYWANYDLEILLGDICKSAQMYQQAEHYYLQASMMCPCRFYPLNVLYDLYKETGNEQKALAVALKVREKPIKVKSLLVMQIKYKMKQVLLKSGLQERDYK